MIKHICICDKCGKEEKLKSVDYLPSEKMNKNYDVYDLPDKWTRIGILPKYSLCPDCTYKLDQMKVNLDHEFMKVTYLNNNNEEKK